MVYGEIQRRKAEQFRQGLEVLFTPWQVSILKKRATGEPLTNAERQELSRRIKPKILAIDALQDLKLLIPFFSTAGKDTQPLAKD